MGRALRAAVAGAGSIAALALFAPASALAHPCAAANANVASGFLSVNNAMWAGLRPVEVGHDCSGEGGPVTAAMKMRGVTGDPLSDAVNPSTFDWSSNMTPLGYAANVIPYLPAPYNSDLAFQGKYAYQGTNNGFVVIDIENPADPGRSTSTRAARRRRVTSWSTRTSSSARGIRRCRRRRRRDAVLRRPARRPGLRGHPHLRHLRPDEPEVRPRPALLHPGLPRQGCGSHTATAVPDEARGNLYIYNGGSSGTCTWMDVLKIKMSDPTDATYVKQAPAGRQCHDNTVFLNGADSRASCSGGNGITMFKFDATIDPTLPGGIENPIVMWNQPLGVGTGHSAAFSYDGKTVVFGHEPGGGVAAQCQTSSSVLNRSLFFLNTETGATISTLQHPRFQDATENCTWHNFNTVPTKGGNFLVSGNYQAGITVIDYTQPAAPKAIAFADPKPLPRDDHLRRRRLPGRRRLVDLLVQRQDLRVRHLPRAHDLGPRQLVHQAGEHGRVLQPADADRRDRARQRRADGHLDQRGRRLPARFRADGGVHVRGRGPRRRHVHGARRPWTRPRSAARRSRSRPWTRPATRRPTTVNYMVNSIATQAPAGGSVAATLALTMGAPAQFGAFVPGVAREYTATTTANVISTAGDATLSVADPSPTNTGRLVNGTFALPQPLQGLGVVKTYAAPVSNDQPAITFKQAIGANDALRTGTYSKTLTFTLSTTAP